MTWCAYGLLSIWLSTSAPTDKSALLDSFQKFQESRDKSGGNFDKREYSSLVKLLRKSREDRHYAHGLWRACELARLLEKWEALADHAEDLLKTDAVAYRRRALGARAYGLLRSGEWEEGRKSYDELARSYARHSAAPLLEWAELEIASMNREQAEGALDLLSELRPELRPFVVEKRARMGRIGQKAPELRMPLMSGDEFDLGQRAGQVVVVVFWASWDEESLRVLLHHDRLAREAGAHCVGISLDPEPESPFVGDRLDVWGFQGSRALLKDGFASEVVLGFDVRSVPSTWILAKDGTTLGIDFEPSVGGEVMRRAVQSSK